MNGSVRGTKLDAAARLPKLRRRQVAANLLVRRSPQGEGGKELGYGG